MDIEKLKKLVRDNPVQAAAGALAVLLVAGVVAFTIYLNGQGNNKGFSVEGSRLIVVKDGMTTADIAELLHEKKLVKNPAAFKMEARWKGLATKLQAGAYQIDGGMSNQQIVDVMVKGRIKLEAEGLGSADKFMAAAKDYAPYPYMQTDDSNVLFKAEGFIYPATYDFPVGISEQEMLKMMVAQFDKEMQSSGIAKTVAERNLPLRDVVNMASMVELEAVFAEEQPKIAGVFLKRVAIGMPIQSDTTIQYLLGTQKEVVTFADTKIQSPYNTYQNPGLPPGPIGSPGLTAIKAVLQPEQTDYLYFVAEKDGHHRFTKTYAEHLKAIEEIG